MRSEGFVKAEWGEAEWVVAEWGYSRAPVRRALFERLKDKYDIFLSLFCYQGEQIHFVFMLISCYTC